MSWDVVVRIGNSDSFAPISQEWVDCFASIAEEIKHLNKRGVENAS